MIDKRRKRMPWGWLILFLIVVLYFFASYLRGPSDASLATVPQPPIPPSLESAVPPPPLAPSQTALPKEKKAHTKGAQPLREAMLRQDQWAALQGWTVQVAAVNDAQSAQRLVEQLRQNHLPAYKKQQSLPSGQPLIRVYVGPVLHRHGAEQLRYTVEQAVALKGLVVAYEPVLQAASQVS